MGTDKYMYASNMDASEQKLAYDLYYLRNLSFALDFEIILATLRSIGKESMKKVLITGGAGYIGSHTTLVSGSRLRDRGN